MWGSFFHYAFSEQEIFLKKWKNYPHIILWRFRTADLFDIYWGGEYVIDIYTDVYCVYYS